MRSLASACRRRVAPLLVQFPPFGGALDVGRARPCTSHSASPPVWWGFCSMRSLASACRRRVVSTVGQALLLPINVARNSRAISSNVEFTSLESQRFRAVSKSDRGEITCEICLEVVGSPPAGAVARPVSRSAPAASDPPTSAPGCMSGRRWGFCSIRSILPACRRRVVALLVQFPPFAGGEVTIRGGVVPKVQTTSARNANNGLARARWSAMWAQQRLAACVARARTAECAR